MKNPLIKLCEYLDISGISYTDDPDPILNIDRVKYTDEMGNLICSAIWGTCSYGYDHGLIEIMGLLTPEEEEYDEVVGYLTPEDVFFRIVEDWRNR